LPKKRLSTREGNHLSWKPRQYLQDQKMTQNIQTSNDENPIPDLDPRLANPVGSWPGCGSLQMSTRQLKSRGILIEGHLLMDL